MKIPFSYIITFISLIYGLAIAHGLSCIAEYIQQYKKLKHYWIWWTWAILLLIISINFWWSLYTLWSPKENLSLIQFTFIAVESYLFYLLFRIFFDYYSELEVKDLKIQYYKYHGSFFIIFAIKYFLMFYVTLMIVSKQSLYELFMMAPPILPILLIILALTKKHIIHGIITVLMLLFYFINLVSIG